MKTGLIGCSASGHATCLAVARTHERRESVECVSGVCATAGSGWRSTAWFKRLELRYAG